jgi:hypothetical protein
MSTEHPSPDNRASPGDCLRPLAEALIAVRRRREEERLDHLREARQEQQQADQNPPPDPSAIAKPQKPD